MQSDHPAKQKNIYLLTRVAEQLGEDCDDFVFVGGCTTALFMTNLFVPDVRYTLDVDCITHVTTLRDYHKTEKLLRKKGFRKTLEDDVICRWRLEDIMVDVMPTNKNVLGFGNKWYPDAIKNTITHQLSENINIKTISPIFFLATKLEAFKDRGNLDFLASHDFEDIISVLDGRSEILGEIEFAPKHLKNYLCESIKKFLSMQSLHNALPSHFIHYGNLADDRVEILLNLMKNIILIQEK